MDGARCARCAPGNICIFRRPSRELYDQASDPGETHNLAESSKAVAGTLASQLADFRNKTSQTLVNLGKPDPEQMQKLQALGYVGSDTDPAQDQKMLSGVDPKIRIEISNLLHDAMFDVEDARYEQAIPLLETALAAQPDMPVANLQYGLAQARLNHFDKAIAPLRKAVTAAAGQRHGPLRTGAGAVSNRRLERRRRRSSKPQWRALRAGRTLISRWPRFMPASNVCPTP